MRPIRRRALIIGALTTVAALTACQSAWNSAGGNPSGSAKPPGTTQGISAVFDEIYDAGFDANNANAPYGDFDIIYVAFGHIDPTTLEFGFEEKVGVAIEQQRLNTLKANTASLRAAGKLKLVMSLGWGSQEVGPKGYELIEQQPTKTAESVASFLTAQGLDGFDIDYEDPLFSSVAAFQTVAAALRSKLGPDKLLTITPNTTASLDGPTLNSTFDYVNVQSYANSSGGQCGGDAQVSISQFTGTGSIGVEASKILAGQDTDSGCPISSAISAYTQGQLAGVFGWQLRSNYSSTADAMYTATHPQSK